MTQVTLNPHFLLPPLSVQKTAFGYYVANRHGVNIMHSENGITFVKSRAHAQQLADNAAAECSSGLSLTATGLGEEA